VAAIGVRVCLLFGVLIVALACLALAAPASAVPDPCKVSIEMEKAEMWVQVNSNGGSTAEAGGLVTFQKPPGTVATVNLTASTDNGWPITIRPEVVVTNSSAPVPFTVDVQVPAAVPVGIDGHAVIDARVSVNTFACTAPPPASIPLEVAPYVDVFGARIPQESRHPANAGFGEQFEIEVNVRSNARVHISFSYVMSGAMSLGEAPSSLDIDPGFDAVSTASIFVSYHGDHLQTDYNGISVYVVGTVNGLPAYQGYLGVLVFVPKGALDTPVIHVAGYLAAFAAVALVAIVVVLRWHRTARRRAALLRLKKIMAQAKPEGALRPMAPPAPPPRRP
jgi:hypothetical protein